MSLDYPGRLKVITSILIRERQEDQSQERRDKKKAESGEREGATSQGMYVTFSSWKRQENGFSPKVSRGNAALLTP